MNEARLPWLLALLILLIGIHLVVADEKTLWIDFSQGLEKDWEMKQLARRPNRFSIVDENGNRVLKAQSISAASGMFLEWQIDPLISGDISWKWKVSTSLMTNKKEKTRAGDDYAARLFLLFEPHFFRWRIPNVCYVWAGNEPVGSMFKSPHTSSVCTIVLQKGNENALQWVPEKRDFVADYRACFGKAPQSLSAVAVMVDTDDTEDQTTAWFDDIKITVNQ
jgi:hypothetical protein